MPETVVDVAAFYAALDSKRKAESLSWRDLARKLALTSSTFTRMAQGHRPDVDTFATLLKWLQMAANEFMRPQPEDGPGRQPEPMAMISAYLRSAKDLRPEDAEALEEIVQVAYKRLKGRQPE